MKYRLDTEPLERAIDRLREGLERYRSDTSDVQIRDGLIQRFEFTYEGSHKTLKRYLEAISPNPERYDAMPFQDLIRSGNEQDMLLGDWGDWKAYREARGKSSHTYGEDVALEVVGIIPAFLREAEYLLDKLKQRL